MVITKMDKFKKFCKLHWLTLLTVLGVILGVSIAFIIRATWTQQWTPREISYIKFLGELFLSMLKGLILPLIILSLVSAIGSLDLTLSRKIGIRAIVYYLTTTLFAIILGIALVLIIRPGENRDGSEIAAPPNTQKQTTTADTLLDLVRNMFPPNLVQACTHQYATVLVPENDTDINDWEMHGEFTTSMNILGLVVASIVIGVAISSAPHDTSAVLQVVQQSTTIIMRITGWVISLAPVGVLFLVCAQMLEMEDLGEIVGKLGLYSATVLSGLAIHGLIVLPLIFFVIVRRNPYKFMINMGQALSTALGTSSSSATLPVTIRCLEMNNGINPKISRFVLPIGATINMDGTALYEAVAAIFIAQLRGIQLSFVNVLAVCLTATAASIGAAGIPQAGLVTMVMVLDVVGLPADDVSLILAVDWFLDRFRTIVNVLGDAYGGGIVEHLSYDDLVEDEPINGNVPQEYTSGESMQSIELYDDISRTNQLEK